MKRLRLQANGQASARILLALQDDQHPGLEVFRRLLPSSIPTIPISAKNEQNVFFAACISPIRSAGQLETSSRNSVSTFVFVFCFCGALSFDGALSCDGESSYLPSKTFAMFVGRTSQSKSADQSVFLPVRNPLALTRSKYSRHQDRDCLRLSSRQRARKRFSRVAFQVRTCLSSGKISCIAPRSPCAGQAARRSFAALTSSQSQGHLSGHLRSIFGDTCRSVCKGIIAAVARIGARFSAARPYRPVKVIDVVVRP